MASTISLINKLEMEGDTESFKFKLKLYIFYTDTVEIIWTILLNSRFA